MYLGTVTVQDKGQLEGVTCGAAGVTPNQLKEWLTFPESWGPTEWGPIPFLPDNTLLVDRMENQWGDVRALAAHIMLGLGDACVCHCFCNTTMGMTIARPEAAVEMLGKQLSCGTNEGGCQSPVSR